ncbi:mycofactocin biosynthesis glycosyltransferase MftF [uncultured Jatrophihabitans sp.]|uniref:mycofactocin biosynthesis glycosyltransferase MftF n=1 Tax=uncultured Jatrophihabitans sp. TaxID=1610747 RepID=UPI0035CA9335
MNADPNRSATTAGPAPHRLPDGFVAALDPATRVIDGGRCLVGGAPVRALFLSRAARQLVRHGAVRVMDAQTASLADRLVGAGLAHPVLASLPEVAADRLTYVIPVRDRSQQLDRLLAALGSASAVVVVDDASQRPADVSRVVRAHGARLVALPDNRGPAAARNAGLAVVDTPFVAFLDSDVVADPAVARSLLRVFADPRVAAVAPRVLGLDSAQPNWISRYESACSSLDLGARRGLVRPQSPIGWVSSACLVARAAALDGGFDEALRVGEDVDLVWRLAERGWRVRYEPQACVRHEHRVQLAGWLGRKFDYGTSAAALARRHPGGAAPAVLTPWAAGVLLALAAQRRRALVPAAGCLAIAVGRSARRLRRVEHPVALGVSLTGRGVGAALAQGSALVLRHWWPLTAALMFRSTRVRRAAAIAAAADALVRHRRLRPPMSLPAFAAARRLDDIAYGAGLWAGAAQARSARALLPQPASRHRAARATAHCAVPAGQPGTGVVGVGW